MGEVFFFFFLGLTNLVNLPSGPRRAARQLRAYKSPLGPFLAHFSSPLYSSLSTKFPRALRALRVRAFSFNLPFQSVVFVYFALEASVHFSSSLCFFFYSKMLVAVLREMHASVYFYFWSFHKHIFCHDLCHVILGKMHAYIFFAFAI